MSIRIIRNAILTAQVDDIIFYPFIPSPINLGIGQSAALLGFETQGGADDSLWKEIEEIVILAFQERSRFPLFRHHVINSYRFLLTGPGYYSPRNDGLLPVAMDVRDEHLKSKINKTPNIRPPPPKWILRL